MEEKTIKVEDVLQNAVVTLNSVMLPVAYENVIAELSRVAKNISAVRDWFIGVQSGQAEEVADDGKEADPE